jgi:mono/diheme cytochrome c family protein
LESKGFVICAIVAITLPVGTLIAQQKDSANLGVYTEQQSARGRIQYNKTCAQCHLETLGGAEYAPSLVGKAFIGEWSEKSVNDLYDRIRATMPADAPGTLPRQVNADLTAFILNANGFPPDKEELKPDPEAMKLIKIGVPKTSDVGR